MPTAGMLGSPKGLKASTTYSSTPASTTLGSQDTSPQTVTEEEGPQDFADSTLGSMEMDFVDFELPPPVIPVDEKLPEDEGDNSDTAAWSSNARLPQLRIRTFRTSPYISPQTSPLSSDGSKHRRRSSRALDDPSMASATRAQLREGATGVEDVLNRVRYDLLESKEASSFNVLVENAELPDLCRHHLLRGECRYGQHCRYQHVMPLRWLAGASPPSSSSGSYVTHVEALEASKLFLLLDSAPSQTARHALLQTVAFVLYKGEVVWCRHVGRPDRQQLWESFLAVHGPDARVASRGDAQAAELMLLWPGNVWERLLSHLQDPCVISGAAAGLLCSCRSMSQSSLTDKKLWEMLAQAQWRNEWPGLTRTGRTASEEEPLKNYAALAQNVHLYRLSWAACQNGPGKFATPKLSPEQATADLVPSPTSPKCEARRSGSTVHVEVGFEVTCLRSNSSLMVASSRRTNEVRLFQSRSLGRLPALRLTGRPGIDALDLAQENDVLVAGGIDGQLTVHAVSDPGNTLHRLGRFCKPPSSRDASFPSPLFAGLHFIAGSGGTQVLAAARSLNTAQILDVARGSVVETCTVGTQDMIACETMDEHSSLLMNAEGMVRLWDSRAPDLVRVADLALTPTERQDGPHLSVNVGDPAAAILSNSALRWVDLRAGCVSEVCPATLWPELFREAGPARLVLARRGLVAAWFDSPTLPIGCWFGAGPALAPMNADFSNAAVTVSSIPLGGGVPSFAVALARPSRRRRRLVYEVCAAAP